MSNRIHIAEFKNGVPALAVTDYAAFRTVEPYDGSHVEPARAIKVAERWYALSPDCPDDGYAEWSAVPTAEESAVDAAITTARAALTAEQLEAVGLAEMKTRSERIAQKLADDAAAEAAKA